MNAAAPNCNVVLVGMPGGGKSAAGRALATLLRRKLSDTDKDAEKAAGMTVADIFAELGEAHFRSLESEMLRAALQKKRQIIAAGGGIVLDKKNRELIRQSAFAIYLCAPPQLLARRLQKDKTARPLLAGKDLAASLSELLAKREPLYRKTAHLAVMQNAQDSPADVAQKARAGFCAFFADSEKTEKAK